MKTIEVVAAVIKKYDKVFATQRGYGEFINMWEFPGGKVEPGESNEEALVREIEEELQTQITIQKFLTTVEYDYPTFHLTMHCYLCEIICGTLTLVEHKAARWLGRMELNQVEWLPADLEIIELLKNI